jgi:hypothetical protein
LNIQRDSTFGLHPGRLHGSFGPLIDCINKGCANGPLCRYGQ